MDIIQNILVFLHILGAAIIVGIWFANLKSPTVMAGQFHAALLQLVTGLLLVGVAEMTATADDPVNHAKIAVKLVIAVVVAVVAFIGQKKAGRNDVVSPGLAHGVGGLAILNIAVATLWT